MALLITIEKDFNVPVPETHLNISNTYENYNGWIYKIFFTMIFTKVFQYGLFVNCSLLPCSYSLCLDAALASL